VVITVQLDPDLESRLTAAARAQGVPLQDYLAGVLASSVVPAGAPENNPSDFDEGLNALAENSEKLPVLPPEAYGRESIYRED
jgi:hypothetical protein